MGPEGAHPLIETCQASGVTLYKYARCDGPDGADAGRLSGLSFRDPKIAFSDRGVRLLARKEP